MATIDQNTYYQRKEHVSDPLLRMMLDKKVVPHDQRRILYKYMPLSTAKLVLENGTIRFSCPLIFEDTFEFDLSPVDYNFTLEDVRERLEISWQKSYPGKSSPIASYSIEQIIAAYQQVFDEQKKNGLIFCSSVSNNNLHLWRKYGDKGRGVCLGFYMPLRYEPLEMLTMHVQYTDQPESYKFFNKDFAIRTSDLARWVNTKHTKWDKEEEIRTFIPNVNHQIKIPPSGVVDVKFDPSQLKEISLGPCLRPEFIKELRKILDRKPYVIEKVERIK